MGFDECDDWHFKGISALTDVSDMEMKHLNQTMDYGGRIISISDTTEKQFESDTESFFISDEGGYTKGNGTYDPKLSVYPDKLSSFIQHTQPREWAVFERKIPYNLIQR